eukprot:jgi/Tetstr1/458442/TSEL_044877.t1
MRGVLSEKSPQLQVYGVTAQWQTSSPGQKWVASLVVSRVRAAGIGEDEKEMRKRVTRGRPDAKARKLMAASSTAQPPGVVKTLTDDKKRKRPVEKRRVTKYIADNLEKHEKLFGYYPYINQSGRHKSIIEIAETACKLAGKNPKTDAVLHHGKMNLKAKTHIMADVNRTWLVPLDICNSAVTCGVSFTQKWFTKSFIAKASWNNPRDLVQFSFRVRNLGGDNTIDIFQLGGSISPKHSKVLIADDPVYRGLIADVNFEQSMPGDDCFRYLCGKVANFEISMEKLYCEVMFKPCTPKGSIATLWDTAKQNFVKTLCKYLEGKGRQSGRVVVPDLAKRVEEYMEAMVEGDRPSLSHPTQRRREQAIEGIDIVGLL